MKAILMLLMLCLLLSGCGKTPEPTVHFSVSRGETEITLDAPAEPVLAALGTPFGYGEQRCKNNPGVEKIYRFSGLSLQTYPGEDGERIMGVQITDGSHRTPEGISIGDTAARVRECFGENAIQGNTCTVQTASEKMVLQLENNLVASIQYSLI